MATRALTIAPALRSGHNVFPANGNGVSIPSQFREVEAHFTMSQADLDSPATSFTYAVEWRKGAGAWNPFLGGPADGHFVGGPNQGKNGGPTIAPGFVFDMSPWPDRTGLVFQLVTDIPSPLSVGVTIDLS
jgi:hypothetical protein